MDILELRNIGPIQRADIEFGDLTVLVGPQATGKSIFLQFLKLMLDTGPVFGTFGKYGLDWDGRREEFFNLYFGEGMSRIWNKSSGVTWQGTEVDMDRLVRSRRRRAEEKCLLIPAQRVLALSRDGWLRPFADYKPGDPYAIRDFSEKLRILMEGRLGRGKAIFPAPRRFAHEIRRLLEISVFGGFELKVEKQVPQKRLVLSSGSHTPSLPFMVWSAGQREFVPLLLGLFWVMPATQAKPVQWVAIEKIEMGLHPRAISAMLLIVLELLRRGYRVCLSTHSPHVLDLVWALRMFRAHKAEPRRVLELFGVRRTRPMLQVADSAMLANTKVYYFDPESRTAQDISSLDPGSEEAAEAGWGGLTAFSGQVADQVARAVAAEEK